MSFNCTLCGKCCNDIGKSVEIAQTLVHNVRNNLTNTEIQPALLLLAEFPHKYDQSGRCEHLSENNECRIYDTRPLICNIDQSHKRFWAHMPLQEFYDLNEQACKDLQNEIL